MNELQYQYNIYELFSEFRIKSTFPTYPPYHKGDYFEEYFCKKYFNNFLDLELNRIFLPIYWTNYYLQQNYGQDIQRLDEFLKTLDKSEKYFTVVQYDDGIINSAFDSFDKFVFTQGTTKNSNCVIPLNCIACPIIKSEQKDIFCSFIGRNTHPIRHLLINSLKNKKHFLISDKQPYQTFSNILSRSVFCLAPRGYGETSFRICEALQRESIPVYISDNFAVPFKEQVNFSDYGVIIHSSEIKNIEEILQIGRAHV